MIAPATALRPGRILRFDLGDLPIVLFRGRDDGLVRALPAHCQHQGVDLVHADVIGDRLRCPLHHWEYSDRCERIPGLAEVPPRAQRASYGVAERYGMIFVHTGAEPPLPLPSFVSVDDFSLFFRAGTPIELDCPWYVPVANAFDMTHLQTVHRRELTSAPETSYPNPMTFIVRYSTGVTGRSWSDRAMRLFSGNRIEVIVTCAGGTMILIEALLAGRRRSYMLISLRPTQKGVSILPLYGVPRSRVGLHHVHARAARLLFSAFLGRDVEALRGIRFPEHYVDPQDTTINECYRHLCHLPAYRIEV